MKKVAGTLAVASGLSIENIDDYAGLIDEVLVASSVETKPYSGVFDTAKLKQFIDKAHSL
jgi:phosphoribosylanthranilate isomerase